MFKCLEATTEYLDHILSLSSTEVLSFTTPDLLRLLYSTLILGRFSAGADAPLLDATFLRTQAKLEPYLTALTEKFQNILIELHSPTDHYLRYMALLFEDTKRWYGSTESGVVAVKESLFMPKALQLAEEPETTPEISLEILDPDFCSVWDRFADISVSADLLTNMYD